MYDPEEYTLNAMRTKGVYCGREDQLNCAALGLSGEAGEFGEKIKKIKYHGHDFNEQELVKELGDILWYITLAADGLGVTLSYIMQTNIEKLRRRYPNGFSHHDSVNRVE